MIFCYRVLRGIAVMTLGAIWFFSTSPVWFPAILWEVIKDAGGLPLAGIGESIASNLPIWGYGTLDRILP